MVRINGIYQSKNCGPFTVIGRGKKTDYFVIRFHNTGTEKEYRSHQIKEGCVRDPYAKTLCGVACTGNIKTKGKYKPFYSIWHDMINRCYNPNDKRAKAYQNVTVDGRWMTFENFYNDMPLIDGYDKKRIESGELVLDKDLKQQRQPQKIYSRETCTWVTKHDNNALQEGQQRRFIATSPDGKEYEDFNIRRFCREHDLSPNMVRAVLKGQYKQTHGWKFRLDQ